MEKTLIKNIGELVTYNKDKSGMIVLKNTNMLIENRNVAVISDSVVCEEAAVFDARGKLVTPGFVDPHTHPVFGDTREMEFEMRIAGKSYQEIAAAGGGIRSSVRSLRNSDWQALKDKVSKRIDEAVKFGVTSMEAKSGYGLSVETELDSLRLLKEINAEHPVDIYTTFLGAHEYPDEYRNNHDAYIEMIIEKMLPVVVREGLADYCDAFCEEGVFSVGETRRVLEAAKFLGLGLRIHADEFKPIGGVELASKLGALSADHLTAITPEGIEALVMGEITPIVLPATTFFLGSDHYAPAREMWDRGLPVALATDFNPGSSMTQSVPFTITVACLKLKLSPLEALQAATYNAAKSLKIEEKTGSLESGKQADFIIWDFDHYQGIPYFMASRSIREVWKNGRQIWQECI